jgi:hypothetical protein
MLGRARIAWVAVALAGCGETAPTTDDAQASERVAGAFDSSSELARLVVPLQASSDLAGMTESAARTQHITNASMAFKNLVANPACVRITTDSATFLDVAFDRCRIAIIFTLDGSLHAGVAIEAPGGMPSAVVTSVTSPGLTFKGPLHGITLSGDFELRHPIPPGSAPVQLTGELGFVNDTGDELTLSTSAEWVVANNCVTFAGGAQLTGNVLAELGPIALSGEQIQSCRNQCPSAGHVELSYGRGTLLAWTYTGAKTAQVIGLHGKTIEVALPCGGGSD